jgi:hypothetical protein
MNHQPSSEPNCLVWGSSHNGRNILRVSIPFQYLYQHPKEISVATILKFLGLTNPFKNPTNRLTNLKLFIDLLKFPIMV